MIIAENEEQVLVDLKTFTQITKHQGIKFEASTWREHIKKGILGGGVHGDGVYAVWVDVGIYNAVFRKDIGCSKCLELKAILNSVLSLLDKFRLPKAS